LDYVIFAALIFYVLTTVSLFALRVKRPDLPRPYRAFGYPVVPALYMLATGSIAVILLFARPVYSVSGLFIVLLGIPVYFLWRRKAATAQTI
jgi:APA family basic amino acid/polyamine antiporter